jgi:hypothetical protein
MMLFCIIRFRDTEWDEVFSLIEPLWRIAVVRLQLPLTIISIRLWVALMSACRMHKKVC